MPVGAAPRTARLDGGRDLRAQYVLGAIGTPCADRARQIGTTPKRSRWASMNWQITGAAGRAPARRKPTRRAGSMVRSSLPTLRLSSRTSLDDSVVTPGAWPSSTAAWRIHLRSVSALIPSRPATALIAAYSDG